MGAFSNDKSFNDELGPSSAAGREYRRTRDDYGRAYRMLRRDRKNPDSAMEMIELRKQANADGFAVGGVRNYNEEQANTRSYANSMGRRAQDQENAAQINRSSMLGLRGLPDSATGSGSGNGATGGGLGNGRAGGGSGNSAAGSGSGNGASGSEYGGGWQNSEYGGGWQQEGGPDAFARAAADHKAAQERSTASGAFGKFAQGRQRDRERQDRREQASAIVDGVIDYTIGGDANNVEAYGVANEEKIKAALEKVLEIGGTEESFRKAIADRIAGSSVKPTNSAQSIVIPPNNKNDKTKAPSTVLNPPESNAPSTTLSEILIGLQDVNNPKISAGKAADASVGVSDMYDRDAIAARLEEIKLRNSQGKPTYAPGANTYK